MKLRKRRMLAICIGFWYADEYLKHKNDENKINQEKLSSSYIDLFRVHKYFTEIGCKSIYILTDLINDLNDESILHLLLNRNLSVDIRSFLSELRNNNQYREVKTKIDLLRNIEELLKLVTEKKRIFIYYTGHGSENNILLPNLEYLDVSDLHKEVLNKSEKNLLIHNLISNTQISYELFYFFDCCAVSTLFLPFKWDNRFRLANHTFYQIPVTSLFAVNNNKSQAYADGSGSKFTQFVFKILHQNIAVTTNTSEIFNEKNHIVTAKHYISYNELIQKLKEDSVTFHIESSRIESYLPQWLIGFQYNIKSKENLVVIEIE